MEIIHRWRSQKLDPSKYLKHTSNIADVLFLHWDEAYFVVVVEGQSTNFTVVRVGVLLWDILKCTVRNVGIGGHGFLALSARCLAQNLLCHLPQSHGTISGPCERQQIHQVSGYSILP